MGEEIKSHHLRALACDIEDCHNPQSWADYCRAAAAMLETQAARIAELEAALATARQEGLEEAAQDLEGRAKMLRSFDPDSVGAHWAWHYAAAIRAALGEKK